MSQYFSTSKSGYIFLLFSLIFILFVIYWFIALDLCCSTQAFFSFGEQKASLCCDEQAPHCSGFSCRAWALGAWGSVVAACRLSSCGSRALDMMGLVVVVHRFNCPAACGIFLDQTHVSCIGRYGMTGKFPCFSLTAAWFFILWLFYKV